MFQEEQKGDVIEAQALHELGDLYLMGKLYTLISVCRFCLLSVRLYTVCFDPFVPSWIITSSNCGNALLKGIPGLFGVARDVNAAVKSFKDAAALGYGPSLHFLALASSVGIGPVKVTVLYKAACSVLYLSCVTFLGGSLALRFLTEKY